MLSSLREVRILEHLLEQFLANFKQIEDAPSCDPSKSLNRNDICTKSIAMGDKTAYCLFIFTII